MVKYAFFVCEDGNKSQTKLNHGAVFVENLDGDFLRKEVKRAIIKSFYGFRSATIS